MSRVPHSGVFVAVRDSEKHERNPKKMKVGLLAPRHMKTMPTKKNGCIIKFSREIDLLLYK
jgi:hypothetical protein